jgi:hypothetical protein
MKFDKAKDPAACAAKSPTRYAVQGVAVVEKGDATFLAATDGRSLSMVRAFPQDGDDMPSALGNGRIYPPAAFAAARKACKRAPDASLTLNGAAFVEAAGASTEFARVDGTFPDVFVAIPTTKPVQVLRLNAEYLARLQKALGANGVAIEVHALVPSGDIDDTMPLTIRPLYTDGPGVDDGSFGVLMPIQGC